VQDYQAGGAGLAEKDGFLQRPITEMGTVRSQKQSLGFTQEAGGEAVHARSEVVVENVFIATLFAISIQASHQNSPGDSLGIRDGKKQNASGSDPKTPDV
jgi:hypothetical protein